MINHGSFKWGPAAPVSWVFTRQVAGESEDLKCEISPLVSYDGEVPWQHGGRKIGMGIFWIVDI